MYSKCRKYGGELGKDRFQTAEQKALFVEHISESQTF